MRLIFQNFLTTFFMVFTLAPGIIGSVNCQNTTNLSPFRADLKTGKILYKGAYYFPGHSRDTLYTTVRNCFIKHQFGGHVQNLQISKTHPAKSYEESPGQEWIKFYYLVSLTHTDSVIQCLIIYYVFDNAVLFQYRDFKFSKRPKDYTPRPDFPWSPLEPLVEAFRDKSAFQFAANQVERHIMTFEDCIKSQVPIPKIGK